jgi:DNA-binding XRE family transcriptional regulator
MPAIRLLRTIADLSAAFKERRLARGIQQHRLAGIIALSRTTVVDIESVGTDPKLSTTIKIAEALGYRLALIPLDASEHLANYEVPRGRYADLQVVEVDNNFDFTGVWKGDL